VVIDGRTKVFLNVSWDSALADELSIEVNESSISRIITSDVPDPAAILRSRKTGIMFDSIDAALGSKYGSVYRQLITLLSQGLKNISAFSRSGAPHWYAPAGS
jgi:hypothetical protein